MQLPGKAGLSCQNPIRSGRYGLQRPGGLCTSLEATPLSGVTPGRAPPRLDPGLPFLDDLPKVDLRRKFVSHHKLITDANERALQVKYLGKSAVLLREPEDVADVLLRRPEVFVKHPRLQRLNRWLGDSVGVQPDAQLHAQQRELLSPAFRPDYVRGLASELARRAAAFAQALCEQQAVEGAPLEFQDLFKRYSLDVMGATSFRYDFGALRQCKQLLPKPDGGNIGHNGHIHTDGAASSSSNSSSSSSGRDEQEDIIDIVNGVESMVAWLLLQLPVPDALLPGYSRYEAGVTFLEGLVYGVMDERRREGLQEGERDLLAFMLRATDQQRGQGQGQEGQGQGQRHQPAPAPPAAPVCPVAQQGNTSPHREEQSVQEGRCPLTGAAGSGSSSGSSGGSSSSSSRTDKQLRDELVFMLSAGTDTTAYTLAFALHHLAHCPQAQHAARQEALEVLAGRHPSELTAEDARGLVFVTACIQEAMRLYPTVPELTRLVVQDTAVGPYHVSKGSQVVACVYSMHRHPGIWPAADRWLPQRWMADGWSHAYWTDGQGQAALGPRQANAFLPFGTGPRGCIGRNYAMLNMQMALAALLSSVEVAPAEGAPGLELRSGLVMRSGTGVWLRVRPLRGRREAAPAAPAARGGRAAA